MERKEASRTSVAKKKGGGETGSVCPGSQGPKTVLNLFKCTSKSNFSLRGSFCCIVDFKSACFIYIYSYIYIYLFVCLFVCLFSYLFVFCLFVCLFVCLFLYLFIYFALRLCCLDANFNVHFILHDYCAVH